MADLQVDKHLNPSVMLINIKASKADQFRRGHLLRIGASGTHICAVRALMNYLHHRGDSQALCSYSRMVIRYPVLSFVPGSVKR